MPHVLIAEDDPGMLEWLAEVIGLAGHQVTTARDGLEAMSMAKQRHFDVLITDISMPHQDGLGLIRWLRASHPDTKIVAFSGRDPATLQDAQLMGADAALVKPFNSRMVLGCISGVLTPGKQALLDLGALCDHRRMASTELRGPFPLRDLIIDKEVVLRCPGAFALGDPEGTTTLQVFFTGRSDRSVNNQLHVYVGLYRYFSYEYCGTAEQAFEAECALFHQFEPRDNPVHPQRPAGEFWTCPHCKLLG